MTYGLTDDEVYILSILYDKRSVGSNRSMNSKLLKRIFSRHGGDFDHSIQNLLNSGLIATIPKGDKKFYISNLGEAIFVLNAHGHETTTGRERPI